MTGSQVAEVSSYEWQLLCEKDTAVDTEIFPTKQYTCTYHHKPEK